MFRRCVFLFSEKYVLERFSFRGIFLGGFSETGAVPKYKKTPVRPHFDKSQKGNMFSDCGSNIGKYKSLYIWKENLGGPGYGTDKKIKHDSNVRQDKQ